MRTLIIAAVLTAGLVPGAASATNTTGTVLLPTGTAVSDGNARPARCTYQLDQQGIFGWVITELTPGAVFELDGTGPVADVDIDFFRVVTTCDQDPIRTAEEHDNRTGDEKGVVPQGATAAIVTLRTGVNVAFTYEESIVG